MNFNKKILITGVNSEITNFLSKKLFEKNYELYGLTSSKIKMNKYYKKIGKINDNIFLKNILPRCKYIIHIGWNREPNNKDNLTLYNKLRKLKSKKSKIIFFSTVAATPNTKSNYGKAKYKISKINSNYRNINLFIGLVDYKFSNHIKLLNKLFNHKLFKIRFTKNIFNVYYVKIETLLDLILKIISYDQKKINYLVVNKIFKINEFLDFCDSEKKLKIYIPYLISAFFIRIIHLIKTNNIIIDKIKTFTYKDKNFLDKLNN